ncbi:MAG TPA: hypothetical protein DIS66_03260, partial [Candidatus Omnitrophica bacterium]|nr:hypothetical protein [Candidatus Omnitrophota bacterium]
HSAVGRPTDLTLFQWSQIIAATLEFKPDLIIELGRGKGNSTCAFAEALQMLKIPASIESLCFSDDWDRETLNKIQPLISAEWLKPIHIIRGDILTQDFNAMTRDKKRILLFWDAHGFEVAECVLGNILPLIASQNHLVIMHDLSDARYSHESKSFYGSNSLWKGNNWEGPRLCLGNIYSAVEQSISAIDFTSRNKITLRSADEDIRTEIGAFVEKTEEMKALLDDLFSLSAHWFHFSLNERSGTFTFPVLANKPLVSNTKNISSKNLFSILFRAFFK